MRVRQHMFDDPIAALAFRICKTVQDTIALRVFDQVIQVAPFLMAKRFAITDEKLKVARVRLIDTWIINLVDDTVTEREPEPATGMIGRTHAFLCARSPPRLDSGRAERYCIFRRIHCRMESCEAFALVCF